MIIEEPYWTICHECYWEMMEPKNRPPYIISTQMKFPGKFKTKEEAKAHEKLLRQDVKNARDKLFVVYIDQKTALAHFNKEWAKEDHGEFKNSGNN